jgi:hypothetical protein
VNVNKPRTPGAANVACFIRQYGAATCAGPGGLLMRLQGRGDTFGGGALNIDIYDGPGAALAGLFIGVAPGSIPMSGGCVFLITPPVISAFFPLPGTAGASDGDLTLPAAVPFGFSIDVYLQVIADNSGAFTNSNGLQLTLTP